MSSLTNFLKLFKWDVNTDGSQKFNINKALNENIDKIEANAVEVSNLLSEKSDKKYKTKTLGAKGWYRVASFNASNSNNAFTNSLIDIHSKWNNTSGQSSIVLISNSNSSSELTLLSSTQRSVIDKIRLIRHPNEENNQRVCLDIHYNSNNSNDVIIQIHDDNPSTQIIDFNPVEETITDETVVSILDLNTYNLNRIIGTLSSLTTTDKTSLVNALNELRLQAFTYMRGNNIEYTTILTNKTFDDAMNLGYSTIFTINGNEETKNGNGFPTGAYQYGLLITLFSSDYARTQIYIPDKPSQRGFYIRTKNDPWCLFSGETVQPISNT